MKATIIYTQPNCKKSEQAKKVLILKNIKFIEKDVSEVETKREMIERTGGRPLTPQIFIEGKHIGTFEDLLCINNNIND
jgi:glutaredoxin